MDELLNNEYVIGGLALLVGWLLPSPKFVVLRSVLASVGNLLSKVFKQK